MNYKEFNGQIYKLLKKPECANKDTETRLLYRLIEIGDSPMARYNRSKMDYSGFRNGCCSTKNCITNSDIARFEIIGYPVAEGSPDWALYQMMQGKKVCSKNDVYIRYLDQNKRVCLVSKNGDVYQGDYSPEDWLYYVESTNCWEIYWEIYEEPKPLLAEAKVGDLVKLRNGRYSQIVEVKDGSVFKYQNPEAIERSSVALFLCDENGDTSRWGKIKDADIIFTEPLAPEGSAEWAWQMMLLSNMVIPIINPQTPWKLIDNRAETEISCASHTRENWIKVASDRVWQIYEEPEKSSYNIIIRDRNWKGLSQTWCGIPRHEADKIADFLENITKPKPAPFANVKVGDWVELSNGVKAQVEDADPEPAFILKASEVVVEIGCLRGTVKEVFDGCDWGFCLQHKDGSMSVIRLNALDVETRELVEELLKQIEEEK